MFLPRKRRISNDHIEAADRRGLPSIVNTSGNSSSQWNGDNALRSSTQLLNASRPPMAFDMNLSLSRSTSRSEQSSRTFSRCFGFSARRTLRLQHRRSSRSSLSASSAPASSCSSCAYGSLLTRVQYSACRHRRHKLDRFSNLLFEEALLLRWLPSGKRRSASV